MSLHLPEDEFERRCRIICVVLGIDPDEPWMDGKRWQDSRVITHVRVDLALDFAKVSSNPPYTFDLILDPPAPPKRLSWNGFWWRYK